jgi:acetate kinase
MMMGTRSGDIDPALGWHLHHKFGMSASGFHHMTSHAAGLKGVSGISGDLRELLALEHDSTSAAEAVALFCYQARKQLCALAGALQGIDTLVFGGGAGEHLAEIRERICTGLDFMGLVLDPVRNAGHADCISAPGSRVTVRIVRVDEQRVIAAQVAQLLAAAAVRGAAS